MWVTYVIFKFLVEMLKIKKEISVVNFNKSTLT